MARAHHLAVHKAQKATKTKTTIHRRHGNITRKLRGHLRVRGVKFHRVRHPEWLPGVHPHGVVRVVAGHRTMSAATKAKIAAALKGKPNPHPGRPLSAAARAKISAKLKGKQHPGHPLSASARAKISAKLKGKHHPGHPLSAATKAKISAKLKGKHHPGRKGVHHKGHPVTAATRAKISAALKGRKHPHRPAHPHARVAHRIQQHRRG
ncbi:NUMOD3 domain-containing DNA-binding protein [Actinocrispum wychmicini]|uniref:NUMOD3 motif-containing protein n=1 Tax=Actinocrispum wychmicini TaxID=1213861 RepID=A0A4R2JC69_9PSEU|nr:NUMOD3 domain-containing DNA-binding protein [Actinocrispum wychmicini]TCO57133.1 NUMOD3 motif-containing protein [Actinocrispum wychmicini]